MACRRGRVCQCAATLAWSAAWRSGLAPCPARWQSAPTHSLAVPSKVQWPRVPGVVAAAAREPTTEVNGEDRETHLAVRPVRGHTLDAAGAALDGFPALAALHKHEFARREEALVRVQMQVVPAVGRERHRGACAGPGDACLGRRRHDRSSSPRPATTSGESEWRRGDGRCECQPSHGAEAHGGVVRRVLRCCCHHVADGKPAARQRRKQEVRAGTSWVYATRSGQHVRRHGGEGLVRRTPRRHQPLCTRSCTHAGQGDERWRGCGGCTSAPALEQRHGAAPTPRRPSSRWRGQTRLPVTPLHRGH